MPSQAIAAIVLTLMIPTLAAAQAHDPDHSSPQNFSDSSPGHAAAPPAEAALAGDHVQAAGQAYRRWSRGQVLPPESRSTPISDYDHFHLRKPPHGYDWYRCGDQFVLASTDSGLIFEVIDGD